MERAFHLENCTPNVFITLTYIYISLLNASLRVCVQPVSLWRALSG